MLGCLDPQPFSRAWLGPYWGRGQGLPGPAQGLT